MDLEKQLRTGLSARAAEIDAAPTGLLDDVLAGHRRSVHRRRAALVAGVAAVLVAVAVPVGVTVTGGANGGDSSQAPVQAAFERYPIEPRGNLADDAGYVDGVLARDWWPASVGPQPAPDTRQVVFVAQVPGGIQALVTGWLDGARVGQWLGGPADASPDQLTPEVAVTVPVADDQAQSFLSSTEDIGSLVVVAAPGDVIELSPGQTITSAGEIDRAPYQVVGDADGTAVVDAATLDTASYGVRVTRDGVPVQVSGGAAGSEGVGGEADLGPGLSAAAGTPDPDVVRLLVQGVLERTGLSGEDVVVGVRWGGPIGNRNHQAQAAVVTVQLPSGASVRVAGVSYAQEIGGDPWTSVIICGQAILPASSDVTSDLVAVRCDLTRPDGSSVGSQVVVVPPAGTATVQLTGAGGGVIDSRELTGPAYVGPAPDGLGGAVALGADGAVVAQAPLLGVAPLQVD